MNATDEIVGVQIGSVVYRDLKTIERLLRDTNLPWQLISRAHMRFMQAADLGPVWSEWACAPTLFLRTEKGALRWPETVEEYLLRPIIRAIFNK